MNDELTIPEQMLFTTVRIETVLQGGSRSTGTGFLFSYRKEDMESYFLVTNKHVINESSTGILSFNRRIEKKPDLGNIHTIEFEDFESQWIKHPEDIIDVAIMPFVPVLKRLEQKGIQIFYKTIPSDTIPSNESLNKVIDAIEDVIFIGYPNNIYDKKNLLPVVRKGITATPISVDFNGQPVFLIDASIFPGSSGSPVFLYNSGTYTERNTSNIVIGSRFFFLGIVASVFVSTEESDIEVIDIPTIKKQIVRTNQMIDLGIVYKSSVIKSLIEDFLKELGET